MIVSCGGWIVSKLGHLRLLFTTFFGRFGGCQDAATLEFSIVLPTLTAFTIKCHAGSQTFLLMPLTLIPHLSNQCCTQHVSDVAVLLHRTQSLPHTARQCDSGVTVLAPSSVPHTGTNFIACS